MSSFAELGLSPGLQAAVAEAGYTTPTPIQAQSIPVVITGRDVLGCAQTGTGKTASFSLPMVDRLSAGRARARMPRSLILEPTRELAAQVEVSFEKYGKGTRLTTALLVGGNSFVEQQRKLDRGVDVLIATPGRLIDLIERGKILLSDVRILVIDEADRMLDMGFIPDVETIVGRLPRDRQTLFFSATMPPEIRRPGGRVPDEPGRSICGPARVPCPHRHAGVDRRGAFRKAAHAPPPYRVGGCRQRDHLLQSQEGRRHPRGPRSRSTATMPCLCMATCHRQSARKRWNVSRLARSVC